MSTNNTHLRMFDLNDRVALVTGAGQGMGLGVVRALAGQGARVAVNDLYAERAEHAVAKLVAEGFDVMAVPGDITRSEIREEIVFKVRQRYGDIDILVNNAGVPPGMPESLRHFSELEDKDFEIQLDLNLRAVLGLTRLVVRGMGERGFGRIVIISSESWRVGLSFGLTNYAAAKSASLGFMRHLAHEVGRKGITANAVSLGTMNNFGYDEQAKSTAVGRAGTPEDVGALVTYLASSEAAWMTGQVLPLNGGAITA
ncbi:SDR family NAD(P)-dependent oxidoreductase [Halomonas sp. PR-M31]|uniref:SDR family NAD(P)-dependent oxidoreductase n=1 Tax=Halomonas sp. PR-M31 TaxID=1471202 RepID=UPI0009E1E03E|nr:SDR family NAD(P)-dependent oxidoreductase [Halomonas sp. PR-M31]